jgi:hypothetical protein
VLANFKDRQREAERGEWGTSNVVLGCIHDSPWFGRKWMIQEFILGRRCFFQLGPERAETSKIFMARQQLIIQRRELSGDPVTRDVSNLAFETYRVSYAVYKNEFKKAGRTWPKKRLLITELLGMGRHQVATNPKDAVFGMYGILQKLDSTIPPPDYSKSVEDIYIEATKLAIMHDNSLEILLETSENRDLPELPSWVPDWNIMLDNGLNP